MKKLKNWIVSSAKNLWRLNWEAKIGILFLTPPIIGVIMFLVELFVAGFDLEYFSDAWLCIYSGSDYSSFGATPAIPLYLGLMAIAGAYLIKGNLKKD
jgi:hypothetical protein